jgi:uncharacterized membrane protein
MQRKSGTEAVFLGLVAFVVLAGATFASAAEVNWRQGGWRLMGGAAALSLTTLLTLSRLGGWRSALRFMAITLAISWLAETTGLRCGWPFGAIYRYTVDVQPVLPGGVPLFIPLAWFVLAGIPVMLLRSMKTARPNGSLDAGRILWKSALGALGMVACDLALDPVAVSHGLWIWDPPGAYYGVPWPNFMGWWAVSFIVFLTGYSWTALGRATAHPVSIRYDLAWFGAHLLLVVLLGSAVNSRAGSGTPMLLAMAVLSPLSLRWLAEVHCKIKLRGFIPRPV